MLKGIATDEWETSAGHKKLPETSERKNVRELTPEYSAGTVTTFQAEEWCDDVETLLNRGVGYHKQRDYVCAARVYQEARDRFPECRDAWYLTASLSYDQGHYQDALNHIHRAFELSEGKPPPATWLVTYGHILRGLNMLENAVTAFENAFQLDARLADAWWGLAVTLYELGRPSRQVENALVQLFALAPKHIDAMLLMAELHQRQQRPAEAVALIENVLKLQPRIPHLRERLARALAADKKYEEALEHASTIYDPERSGEEIEHFLGLLYGETGNIALSREHFRKAADLSGNDIFRWKHLWFCRPFFDTAEEISAYWDSLNRDLDEALEAAPVFDWRKLPHEGFTSSFHLPHHNRCCRDVKEKFCRLLEKSFFFQRPPPRWLNQLGDKIRVGFLVTPRHEGGFYRMTQGIMKGLDRDRFEVYLFYHRDYAGRFQPLEIEGIVHKPYTWDFEQSVQVIRETCCDVMFYWKVGADLWSTCFPMTYLAPIQCTSWGTHGTSGFHQIDHYISWDAAEIPEAREHYTENLFLLQTAPNTELIEPRPQQVSRSSLALPREHAIYFCPHRISKYHPDFDFYLRDILEKDPNGHVLLLLGPASRTTDKLKERMKRNIGGKLFRRVICLSRLGLQAYYQYLSASTVVLDSPYYAGELTCFDAFSVGVPCVTQIGELLIQRYSATRYRYLGIDDAPIAETQQEYVDYAVKLGTDETYRQKLVSRISDNYHKMTEQESVIREYERFFEEAVNTHRADRKAALTSAE